MGWPIKKETPPKKNQAQILLAVEISVELLANLCPCRYRFLNGVEQPCLKPERILPALGILADALREAALIVARR